MDIQKKWQDRWQKKKAFEPEISNKPKFLLTFPYPYINGYPHIGHLYTLMRVEAFARYKRLKGFNVLFPQGWHATGSPIVNAARRVKEKEPKQIKIMKDMGISDSEMSKFENPKHWVDFFMPIFKQDFQSMGLSIDWRREFVTTSLNPYYDKFIQWQFRKLKKKGYVIKGKFPVVWDPKQNSPVGDHDRLEGEGETPQEFLLVRHKLDDGRMVMSATLRQDTILGITNLYVHPKVEYVEIEIETTQGKETWIIGSAAVDRLIEQEWKITKKGTVSGLDLIGKETTEFGDHKVMILPATFLDPDFGTGLVHSVPSDSADDLIALWDLQKDEGTLKKYKLDIEKVRAIKPIEILDTSGIGGCPAEHFLKKEGIKNQNERKKLELIRQELYKLSFYSARFGKIYKNVFDKEIVGKPVQDEKEYVKEQLKQLGWIESYYQLTGKVVSRSLAECVVKVVDDQWFIDYNNQEWKKKTKKALEGCRLYPKKSRQQFEHVIDWLHEWACTREEGLGTRLPWDEKWLIESLSDSTLYNAYYTIVHLIKEIPIEKVNDELFDFVFLGEGKSAGELWDNMANEFNYWYPTDFRNSGKDLIQNHLTFYLFNHTALFPQDKWPKGIGTNGWVTVDGQKMSKSLGNVIPFREMATKFSADASRFTILAGGESMDDPNWETDMAKSMSGKLSQLQKLCVESYNAGVTTVTSIDNWAKSRLYSIIRDSEKFMDETLFRSALHKIYFDLQNVIKWYVKRSNGKFNKEIMNEIIESQLIMLSPFCPHICEEIWEALGKTEFVSLATWPKYDKELIVETDTESYIRSALYDIRSVFELAKVKNPEKIVLILSPEWKYELYKIAGEKMSETKNPGEVLKHIMQTPLKRYGKEISKMISKLIRTNIENSNMELEEKTLKEAIPYFETEFGCKVELLRADETKETKANQALPGKPAIMLV